jgi:hypothetical protein
VGLLRALEAATQERLEEHSWLDEAHGLAADDMLRVSLDRGRAQKGVEEEPPLELRPATRKGKRRRKPVDNNARRKDNDDRVNFKSE